MKYFNSLTSFVVILKSIFAIVSPTLTRVVCDYFMTV